MYGVTTFKFNFFNFGPGDEIIVPAQTHVATVHAIEITGAVPVFVDCELNTGNIDINKLEEKISDKTKAISLVHFVGIPVEMDKICKIARKYKLVVIEDCALALGSFYKDKHVGLWGDVGCFSFYPVKHITTGEGGMLISKNKIIANKIASFRAFNVDREHSQRKVPGLYDVLGVGLNYRMSELQAALGCAQIDKIKKNLATRSQNFSFLKSFLLDEKDIRILDSSNKDAVNSHYCMVILLEGALAPKRNEIVLALKKYGVGCSIYYPNPVPRMSYYRKKYQIKFGEFLNSSIISDHSIALPVGPHLQKKHMKKIAELLMNVIREVGNG